MRPSIIPGNDWGPTAYRIMAAPFLFYIAPRILSIYVAITRAAFFICPSTAFRSPTPLHYRQCQMWLGQ